MWNHIGFLFFLMSYIAGVLFTPLMAKTAVKYGIVHRPPHRKTHSKVIPYLGGVAVFAAFLLGCLIGGMVGYLHAWLTPEMMAKAGVIILCALGVMVIGLLDDASALSPMKKLMGQFFFVTLFAVLGFRMDVLEIPGIGAFPLPPYQSVPLTIFWVLAMINAVNMIDGLDGLAGSITISGFALVAIASAHLGDHLETMLATTAIGAVFAFLFYNWKPAGIYLGDAGSNGLGMLLACLLVGLGRPVPAFFHSSLPAAATLPAVIPYAFFVLTLMNFYPVFEILISVSRRIFRGTPIYRADTGHIHHRLMKKGFSAPQIALVGIGFMFLPGSAALAVIAGNYGLSVWLLGATCLILGVSLPFLNYLDFLHPKVLENTRPHYRIADHFIFMQRLKLSIVTSREELLALVSPTCQEFGVSRCRLILAPDGKGQGGLDYYKEWNNKHPSEYLDFLFSEGAQPAIFTDRCKLPEAGTGAAEWTFDFHDPQDEELDVECRVLMNEFMRSVLHTAVRLGKDKATQEYRNEFPPALKSVSTHSHTLRKRLQGKSKSSSGKK